MKLKKKENLNAKSKLYFLVSLCFVLFISLILIENKTYYVKEFPEDEYFQINKSIADEPAMSSVKKEVKMPKQSKPEVLNQPPLVEEDLTQKRPDPDDVESSLFDLNLDDNIAHIDDIDDLPKTEIIETLPYASVSKAPVFRGCEQFTSSVDQKNCMHQKIAQIISKKLRPYLSKEDNGVKIYVQFTVNHDGKVIDVFTNSISEKLNLKAKSIIQNLPEFTPAVHNQENVKVIYSLPIIIKVN
ncbi:energy transducer TonB [Psychroflexus maritimus]|uniref:TonB C-terminal domain-containing protein n=1 Tax=Psychroflexus maritimus TaxID=2714865 RepID=A0A967ABY5_9FLAO|nr:hypothetical protein [Psychroflexus maritimus]NGZ88793.1 hypothetical protein [Psychroflexus maritimus]